MIKLVFASKNRHKFNEINAKLSGSLALMSLGDIGFKGDIPEPYETLEENATGKALYIFERYRLSCFADDTGLEIDALGGEPGVYSARYAGGGCSFDDNMDKVLDKMKGITNRSARFRTIIAFVREGEKFLFEGEVQGTIDTEKRGLKGFGYDPIFIPNGYSLSFAQMDLTEKNAISHRAIAIEKFVGFLMGEFKK